jgi:hypothetical protein
MSQASVPTLDAVRPREGRVAHPVDADAAVDAARMLAALHQRVERQFQAYQAAEGSHAAQHRAVAAVGRALATHVAVEDELLYPTLRAHTGRHDPEIDRQLAQDHLLDLVMAELGGMVPADRGYDAKVRVLMQLFRQHARDAERLVQEAAGTVLEPAERKELGLRMLERVGQLEGRPRKGW